MRKAQAVLRLGLKWGAIHLRAIRWGDAGLYGRIFEPEQEPPSTILLPTELAPNRAGGASPEFTGGH
jgi:hypothetical protein